MIHGVEGWYLGPAMEHYRCYCVIASKTGGERIRIQFIFPRYGLIPGSSATDRVIGAAAELIDAIINFKHVSLLKDVGDTQLTALKKFSVIFYGATQQRSQKK